MTSKIADALSFVLGDINLFNNFKSLLLFLLPVISMQGRIYSH